MNWTYRLVLSCLIVCVAALPSAAQTAPPTAGVTIASLKGLADVYLPCPQFPSIDCEDTQSLLGPGSVTAQANGFIGAAGTASLTVNVVTSASGEVQRIEFSGSATAHAGAPPASSATVGLVAAQLELLVGAGPLHVTITDHIQVVRDGVVGGAYTGSAETNTTQTLDLPQGQSIVAGSPVSALPFWTFSCVAFAFPSTLLSASATCSRTIEIERRPVLIIPGVGATYSADVSSDLTWLIHRGVPPSQLQIDPMTKVYDDLIQTLKNTGYVEGKDLFKVNYDWRLPPGPDDGAIDGKISGLTAASISNQHYLYAVDYLGDILKQAAEQWATDHPGQSPLDSVDVITHSTGGLVARTYIQSENAYGGAYAPGKTLPKINNLIMIGVPNQGASKAWNPLHDNWVVDPAFQMVLSKIINRAYQKVLNHGLVISGPDYNISLASITPPQCQDLPEICFINQYVPTARALLATYDFIDVGTGLTNVNGSKDVRNSLLLDLNAGDPNGFADPTKVTAKPTIIYGTNGGALVPGQPTTTPTTVVEKVGPTSTVIGFRPIAEFANLTGRDAMPKEIYYSDNKVLNGGDGTVPLISSEGQFIGDSRVILLPFTKGGNTAGGVDHTALPYNTDVQQAILDSLGVECLAPGCKISTGMNSLGLNAATACAAGCSNFGLDPVDGFMVDAEGRRLGFSAATGPLAEIPGSVWFGNTDGMGWVFGPVEEPLTLQLTGLGQDYYVTASVLSPTRIGNLIDSRFLGLGAQRVLPIPLTDKGSSSGTGADSVPPVTAAALSPQPNPAGWNKSDVTVSLSAIDNAGGSGVKDMTYSASGAQSIAGTTVTGTSVPISITAEGQTTVTFFASDNAGNVEAPQTIVVSLDKTPPTLSCSPSPSSLWPPNHRLVTINTPVVVTDSLSGAAGFALQSITSNEPDVPSDIQGFVIGTAGTTGQLRAERAGTGTGRIYTLTYTAMDGAGNSAVCTSTVIVPHNQ